MPYADTSFALALIDLATLVGYGLAALVIVVLVRLVIRRK